VPLTITVKDPLAGELQSVADERQISVEQFAVELLGRAVHGREGPMANRRRLTLIRKQFAEGLSPSEAADLQELQRQADESLESLDSPMLQDISQMEQAAREALDGPTH
jgi:hypothetical protein